LRVQAWVSACLGLIRFHRGPRTEADELFARASEWMERTDDRYMQAQTLVWRAQAALAEGELDLALVTLRSAETIVREFGGALAVRVARYLAEVLGRQKRAHEAREISAVARDEAEAEDQLAQADVLIAESFAAFAAGDVASARRGFSQALPILDKRDGLIDLGEARMSFAHFLEAMGDATSAGDQLERARDVFQTVGAEASVTQAEADLARLRDVELGSGAFAT
jgi:tetratricopeptide (TPR) repeat protein